MEGKETNYNTTFLYNSKCTLFNVTNGIRSIFFQFLPLIVLMGHALVELISFLIGNELCCLPYVNPVLLDASDA